MTKTLYEAAALTAAIAPGFSPSGVRDSEQFLEAGDCDGLQTVVVLDSVGKEFDTTIAQGADAVRLLSRRAVSAIRLREAKEPAGLRFRLDNVRYFKTLNKKDGPQALAVMVTKHYDGEAVPLSDLTESQCGALGAAIGAVHRLNPQFFRQAKFPSFTAEQMERQLRAWVKSLSRNEQIPQQILGAWQSALQEPGLFSFRCRVVHGGFKDGDALFQQNDVTAILHWEDLQVNDPARDLAWIYRYLDQTRREAVTAAYARVMGSRMDDMIMLRARLWVQMEQVRDFLTAVDRADNVEIMDLKARLDHLAHDIAAEHGTQPGSSRRFEHPETLTVGDLLAHPDLRTDAQKASSNATSGNGGKGSADGRTGSNTSRDDEPYTVNAADFARSEADSRHSDASSPSPTQPLHPHGDTSTQALGTLSPGEQVQHFSLPELNTVGLDLEQLSHASTMTWAHDDSSLHEPDGEARRDAVQSSAAGESDQTDDTHSMRTVTESALSMSFIPRRTRTGMRPITARDAQSDEPGLESSPTQIYADATHADGLDEFSDEFRPAVRYGARYSLNLGAGDATEDRVPRAVQDSEDTATVMLPQQPSYFEEDSPQDPARIIRPHFSMHDGTAASRLDPAAGHPADGDAIGADSPQEDEPAGGSFPREAVDGNVMGEPDTNTHHGKIVADDSESTDPSGDFAVTPRTATQQ